MTRVLIGGIGNILLGDDGVGPYVVRSLEAAREFGEEVEIVDLGTPALDLIYKIVDLDLLILVDAIANSDVPGTISSYSKADLLKHAPSTRMDPHSPALSESLLATEMLGASPKEVLLIAVAGGSYETSCTLSEPVRLAVDEVLQIIMTKLDEVGVQSTRREAKPDIWWDRAPRHLKTLYN
jgi:hydrogenase maturation protease